MDAKIQELTDKIYREGVEKGNEEAGRIIAQAKAEEQNILQSAREEAEEIVAQARKEAAEWKKNTVSELKMFASQAVEALKSEVTNLITGKVASENVKAASTDADFMKKMMLEIAREWTKNGAISIQTSDAKALTLYFQANAVDLLNQGVTIEEVNGRKTSFSIAPADGSYKISFGEEEFITYFKEFLRPQLIDILF
ncbi:ATP synthase subunit E [Tannerella forsythia]|uniref:ATP synthase subunit E n=1 Tax=Tannerella forsythia TaxID=28112 RepID=UPI00062B2AC2|nr:ATP synthase subunit E [Tannerella forsythia]KKY61745.1 ATP synthase subunit E [Tannerella forsythia]TPE17565.1 hypothetical protein FJN16_02980 [Tannerella forsythia]